MKITYNWLKDFIDIDISAEEVANKLTKSGFEVEEVIYQNKYVKNVVVGKILEITKHPNADKIVVCKVDIGNEIVQILTSATNVFVGAYVPVSLEGANLANGISIKKSLIRGVASDGMFCSGEELGITDDQYPNASFNGILILQDEPTVGTPIENVVGLDDIIMDINVTSNRPDCMSVVGIAREVSAVLSKPMKKFIYEYKTDEKDNISNYIDVEIQNEQLCPRYMAAAIKDIKLAPSPSWMKNRLNAVGIKSINNIVDITNYVLVEYGQPLHSFDHKYLNGHKIIVRNAKANETIEVLNHNSYKLDDKMLVICDEKEPVVIAGIIGGINSCVSDKTTTSIFEAASFDRASVRVTSRTIGVRTDSTARFEKGVDISSPPEGLNRALSLIYTLKAGTIVNGIIDKKCYEPSKRQLQFSLSKISKILGVIIPNDNIVSILSNLGFKPNIEQDTLSCEIPLYRTDIENDADIAEELIRIYGYDVYDSIEQEPLEKATYTVGQFNKIDIINNDISNILCNHGFYEAINFTLCSNKISKMLCLQENSELYNNISIANPISDDLSCLRTSMAGSLLTCLSFNNKHGNKDCKIFECGRVYIRNKEDLGKSYADERNYVAFASTYKNDNFAYFKSLVQNSLQSYDISYKIQYSKSSFMHPGISADFVDYKTNKIIATFGKINPIVCKNFELSENIFYGEINIDFIASLQKKKNHVKQISKFPSVERDLAFVVDEKITCDELVSSIKRSCANNFEAVNLFDIYRNNEILGENKKSMAFTIKLTSQDKTLTVDEINNLIEKILKDVQNKFGAKLR